MIPRRTYPCPTMVVAAALLMPPVGQPVRAAEPPPADPPVMVEPAKPTQQELMAKRGYVRHRGGWRTAQEIDIIERNDRATLAEKEWNGKLERLRRQVDQPAQADRAAEEIREISDPAAVSALAAMIAKDPVFRVRTWCLESLSRIRSSAAVGVIVAAALDHPDPETRIAAVERLMVIGPHLAVPTLVAALKSADNGQVNRAAEALGRLGMPAAVGPLIDALDTEHIVVTSDGKP